LRIGSPACALKPRLDDFLRIAPKNRRTLSYHILCEKRIPECGAKNKEAALTPVVAALGERGWRGQRPRRQFDRRGVGRSAAA
jgi:hypothetical protein